VTELIHGVNFKPFRVVSLTDMLPPGRVAAVAVKQNNDPAEE